MELTHDQRIQEILEWKVPIYRQATAEHPKDCWQTVSMKNYKRDLLRIKLVHNIKLLEEYEYEKANAETKAL